MKLLGYDHGRKRAIEDFHGIGNECNEGLEEEKVEDYFGSNFRVAIAVAGTIFLVIVKTLSYI